MKPGVIERTIKHHRYTERHLTKPRDKMKEVDVKKLISQIEGEGSIVIKIVCMGNKQCWDKVKKIADVYPLLFLADTGDEAEANEAVGGFYIVAISTDGNSDVPKVSILNDSNGRPEGYCIDDQGVVTVARVTSDVSSDNFGSELNLEYEATEQLLRGFGMNIQNIYRFWNYMTNVFQTYQSFNEARDKLFDKHQILVYPAATGIQANFPNDKKVIIGSEAISQAKLTVLSSTKQCEAYDYGPRFSRGIQVEQSGSDVKKIYISGISTADNKGESLYIDDAEANVQYVLDSVYDLLSQSGATFENIVSAHVYSANNEIKEQVERVFAARGISFPYTEMKTPICREDFLFEIECLAVC